MQLNSTGQLRTEHIHAQAYNRTGSWLVLFILHSLEAPPTAKANCMPFNTLFKGPALHQLCPHTCQTAHAATKPAGTQSSQSHTPLAAGPLPLQRCEVGIEAAAQPCRQGREKEKLSDLPELVS